MLQSGGSIDQLLVDKESSIRVSRELLKKSFKEFPTASIDVGSELTKVAYTNAPLESEANTCFELHFAQFETKNLQAALHFLKVKLGGSSDSTPTVGAPKKLLRVTGASVALHSEIIKNILGVDLEFVDEFASQCWGLHFLIKHCPAAEFCSDPPMMEEQGNLARGEMFERFVECQKTLLQDQSLESPFPCMLVVLGSASSIFIIREDGSWECKSERNQMAGKTFLGICQLLVGTSDYNQVMRLAAAGYRGNVDTQIRDVVVDAPNSPYGRLPPSMPLFGFGKAVDFDKALENSRPEDVAQSLVSSFAVNLAHPVFQLASFEKIRHVYFGGNFFRHDCARSEAIKGTKLFNACDSINMKFLHTNNVAALGALLA